MVLSVNGCHPVWSAAVSSPMMHFKVVYCCSRCCACSRNSLLRSMVSVAVAYDFCKSLRDALRRP
eukprot:12473057-Alexandrium_andersonii.AAC.1